MAYDSSEEAERAQIKALGRTARGMELCVDGKWECVGAGPMPTAGAVWRVRVKDGDGWLYAMWNVEAKVWSMTFVPALPPL